MKVEKKTTFCVQTLILRPSSEHVYQKKRLGEYFEGIEKEIPFLTKYGSFWPNELRFFRGEGLFPTKNGP